MAHENLILETGARYRPTNTSFDEKKRSKFDKESVSKHITTE
jgi:hypothetical protein